MAVGPTLVQQGALEGKIISCCTIQPAPAHLKLRVLRDLELDWCERAVFVARMHPCQTASALRGQPEAGVRHPNRLEQMLCEILAKLHSADPLDCFADPIDAGAVIPGIA